MFLIYKCNKVSKKKMNKLEEYKSKINYDVWEDLMWSSIVDEQKKIELKKLMKKDFWDEENGGES